MAVYRCQSVYEQILDIMHILKSLAMLNDNHLTEQKPTEKLNTHFSYCKYSIYFSNVISVQILYISPLEKQHN